MNNPLLSRLPELAPPRGGVEPRDPAEWARVERVLGTRLPADYRALVDTYGRIGVDDYIWPFLPEPCPPLIEITLCAPRLSVFIAARPDLVSAGFKAFPEPGGLLLWGCTAGASCLTWKTGGDADSWPLIFLHRDGIRFETFTGGVVDFFVALLEGCFFGSILPDNWLARPELSYPDTVNLPHFR